MKPKDPSLMSKYVKIRTCRCYVIVKDVGHIFILTLFKLIIIPHLKNETKFNYG